jgi:uncharacterized protein (TIGR03000 family)
MYSVVLAAMLTAGPAAAPSWGHGCNGCCGGYNAFSSCCGGCCGGYSYSCCGGCCGGYSYSCCGGCYGGGYSWGGCCGGYSSCFGCCGYSTWSSYYGCCGGWHSPSYSSCWGSCYGGWHPVYSYGCGGGCCGGVIVEPATTAPVMPKLAEPKKEASAAAPATVVVRAPLDVHITVNGKPADRTEATQVFTTPTLDAGRTYSYEFRAEATRDGKTVTRTRKVIVKAGQESTADFSDLTQADGPAHVIIAAPADARVTVDGVEIPATARSFNTPSLEAGRKYYYTVKATMTRDGRAVNDNQHVVLESGKDVKVEFKEPAVATAGK